MEIFLHLLILYLFENENVVRFDLDLAVKLFFGKNIEYGVGQGVASAFARNVNDDLTLNAIAFSVGNNKIVAFCGLNACKRHDFGDYDIFNGIVSRDRSEEIDGAFSDFLFRVNAFADKCGMRR